MTTYFDGSCPGVSFPVDSRPCIKAKHVDGPLLVFSDGQMHWLTWGERIKLWLGKIDAESLQRTLRPRFSAALAEARNRVESEAKCDGG